MIFKGVSLIILAGGESRRMGFPKHLLPVSGGTVMDHMINRIGNLFGEIIIAGRDLEILRTDVRIVEDVRHARSPLVGILSGLLRSENPHALVIGCDMPFVRKELIRHLASKVAAGTDVVVPVVRGFYEPLCAVYSRSTSGIIEKYIDSGGAKVTGFFEFATVAEVGEDEIRLFDPRLESFINLNTPRDYVNYRIAGV
ncbi:MAG: molybdenum cofactor guanylyltransferase [Candidatus Sabulitectum sp.]|nr:molybdenum cofactor guanylyltransferase [Candidatus Sabulitectum sp.]